MERVYSARKYLVIGLISVLTVGAVSSAYLLSKKNLDTRDKAYESSVIPTGDNLVASTIPTKIISKNIWGLNYEGYNAYTSITDFYNNIDKDQLNQLGVKMLRFPGGCPSDTYNWKTGRLNYKSPSGVIRDQQSLTIDEALTISKDAGAELLYEINITNTALPNYCGQVSYNYGTVADAVAIVNTYKGKIKQYELGNEQWANWETQTYADMAYQYASAMKAADPTISIGVIAYGSTQSDNPHKTNWTSMIKSLLTRKCGSVDCFDFVGDHAYSDASYNPLKDNVNGNQYLVQMIYSPDKSTAYAGVTTSYRTCPISDTVGIIGEKCSTWSVLTSPRFQEVDADPGDYGSYVFTQNGEQKLQLAIYSKNGKTGWSRTCSIAANSGVQFDKCTAWSRSDLSNLRGVGNEAYRGFAAYVYVQNGKQVLRQSLIEMSDQNDPSKGGNVSWSRSCPVDAAAGIQFGQCTVWAKGDMSGLRGGTNEFYGAQGFFIFTQNGQQQLRQSIYSPDGKVGYYRTCPIDATAGIQFGQCNAWATSDSTALRGLGNETYTGYDAFVMKLNLTTPVNNFRGVSTFYPSTVFAPDFSNQIAAFAPKGLAVTEWNQSCGEGNLNTTVKTLSSVEQGVFVAESLITMAKVGVSTANLHDLSKGNGCSVFANNSRLEASGQAFKLTSVLAGGYLLTDTVSSPKVTLGSESSCSSLACMKGGVTSPYLTSLTAFSADKKNMYVFLVNKHATEVTNVTLNFGNMAGIATDSAFDAKSLIGSSYATRFFTESAATSRLSGKSLAVQVPGASIIRIAIPYNAPVPTVDVTSIIPTSIVTASTAPTAIVTNSPTPSVQPTSTVFNGDGLTGSYFNNDDLTSLKLTRIDPSISFVWKTASPAKAIGSDTFSIRWTGKVQAPTTGTYTFYLKSDDGSRLWINGKLVVSNWKAQSSTERSGTITLNAGQKYDIKIEYFEKTGGADVSLSWEAPSVKKTLIPTKYLYSK